jgi:hypothetical protein
VHQYFTSTTDGLAVDRIIMMPRTQCQCMHKEKMTFFVGKFVIDESKENTLNMWIVAE